MKRSMISHLVWVVVLILVGMSMRIQADEKRSSTDASLLPQPILGTLFGTFNCADTSSSEAKDAAHKQRAFSSAVLAEGLLSPDGLAVDPATGTIYFSEEDPAYIGRLDQDGLKREVINRYTSIYEVENGRRLKSEPLRNPEGIALAPDGSLYVVEDVPGGRLIRFVFDERQRCLNGEVVSIPGNWEGYAWEGVDVNPDGELLLAGSDLEGLGQRGGLGVFEGVIIFKDADNNWWVPYERVFTSFSSVHFSKSRKQALYTCELTGEIGWLDLQTHMPLGGNSSLVAKSPEGICYLPNGMLLVAQEGGSVLEIDPSTDESVTLVDGLKSIESVVWDPVRKAILVTEDGSGRILLFKPDQAYDGSKDSMDFAVYHPIFSPKHIPETCPDYLSDVLAMVGVRFNQEEDGLSFREFADRVPLIAADAKVVPVEGFNEDSDPIEHIQFVVFNPNKFEITETGPSLSLAVFAARTRSGEVIRTSLFDMAGGEADILEGTMSDMTATTMCVPQPSAVNVSSIGMATLHFMGLGKTDDFAVSIDPQHPENSYMVVFSSEESASHYRLELPKGFESSGSWIIAYSGERPQEWLNLSSAGGEQQASL